MCPSTAHLPRPTASETPEEEETIFVPDLLLLQPQGTFF